MSFSHQSRLATSSDLAAMAPLVFAAIASRRPPWTIHRVTCGQDKKIHTFSITLNLIHPFWFVRPRLECVIPFHFIKSWL
jgi:hypothetical protein